MRDRDKPWTELRKEIKFDLLGHIPPDMYSEHWRDSYLGPLTMTRRDFMRWFRRLRTGRYDADYHWP